LTQAADHKSAAFFMCAMGGDSTLGSQCRRRVAHFADPIAASAKLFVTPAKRFVDGRKNVDARLPI